MLKNIAIGILGRRRERDQHAANRLQVARHPPALGGDERARARLDQRFGDVDRRALGPAGVEPRDHLQHGAPGEARTRAAERGEARSASTPGPRRAPGLTRAAALVNCRANESSERLNLESRGTAISAVGADGRRIAFRRRAAVSGRRTRRRLARRLQIRHGFDQGERARRPLRDDRPRLPALRLFRPRPHRRRFRARHDLALARGGEAK